jgi:DNA-binding transcriptional MocR family regulator
MQIDLDRSSREPLYRQLAGSLQQRIRSGALPPCTRLPTVRQLAQQLGVTRLTVHSAYAELQSGGWVEATVGRGTFVAERIEELVASPIPALGKEVTPGGMMADMLRMAQLPGIIGLARADPAAEFYPIQQWQRANEMALAAGGTRLMGYTTAQGDQQLRSVLSELVRERGISATPDEIIVTSGVTNGMALATALLARPGAAVLVEQPTYLGLLNILSVQGVRPVGVAMDDEGVQLDALEAAIIAERPAFLYTIPTYQNPSGLCTSAARREAVLALAHRHNLMIVEDDVYGRLTLEGAALPAIKAHDRDGLVIYLSSFAKSLMPGLRIGYAVAAPSIVERLAHYRQAQDMCSPLLTQRALALFVEQGWLHAHLRRMLPRYRERRDTLLQALERFFPSTVSWTRPQGGFSCWVTLPASISVTDLYLSATARHIAFAPGDVFKATPDGQSHLRICFGVEQPERIAEAVATLGSLLRERSYPRPLNPPALRDCVPIV